MKMTIKSNGVKSEVSYVGVEGKGAFELNDEFRNNKELLLDLLRTELAILKYISDDLTKDSEFMLKVLNVVRQYRSFGYNA